MCVRYKVITMYQLREGGYTTASTYVPSQHYHRSSRAAILRHEDDMSIHHITFSGTRLNDIDVSCGAEIQNPAMGVLTDK